MAKIKTANRRTPRTDFPAAPDFIPVGSDPANLESAGLSDPDFEDLDELLPPDEFSGRLQVARTQPQLFRGERITGYLGCIPWGENILDYIQRTWGGGTFSIQQWLSENGGRPKYIQSRRVTIVGPPRVSPPTSGSDPSPAAAGRRPAGGNIEINGQQYQVSNPDFWNNLKETMVLKAVLADKAPATDINAGLAKIVLDLAGNRNPGDLSALNTAFDFIERIKETATPAPAQTGATWTDILMKGVDAFAELVKKSQSQPSQNIQTPVRSEIQPQIEGPTMNPMQIANTAVGVVASAFAEDPPLTAEQTVDILRQVVPEGAGPVIRENAPTLWNMAKLAYHEKVEPTPETDEEFRLFYERVFSIFLSVEPDAAQKGGT